MGYLKSLRIPTLTWSNLTSLVMTYYDHVHPIKTNTYKSAKYLDIGLKPSEYDQMGYLISFLRPALTWFNLTPFIMAYHYNGHPIIPNNYISQTQTQLSLGLAKPNLFYCELDFQVPALFPSVTLCLYASSIYSEMPISQPK